MFIYYQNQPTVSIDDIVHISFHNTIKTSDLGLFNEEYPHAKSVINFRHSFRSPNMTQFWTFDTVDEGRLVYDQILQKHGSCISIKISDDSIESTSNYGFVASLHRFVKDLQDDIDSLRKKYSYPSSPEMSGGLMIANAYEHILLRLKKEFNVED